MSEGGSLFSIPAFFIVFRETLEAAIICSVLLGVLKKTNLTHLNRYVWLGVALGLAIALVVLVVIVVVFNIAAEKAIDNVAAGDTQTLEEIEEAQERASLRLRLILSLSAAILIAAMTWTLDGILKKHQEIEAELGQQAVERLENAIETTENGTTVTTTPKDLKAVSWRSIFFLSATTVAREGIETVIFLGIVASFSARTIPLPLVAGLFAGAIAGIVFFQAGSTASLEQFFQFSVVFLTFVGAGVFSHGFEELVQLQGDKLGWWGVIVFDIRDCCGLENYGFALLRAMLGYTPNPTRLELIAYFFYHAVIITGFIVKWQLTKRKIDVGKKIQKAFGCEKKQMTPEQIEAEEEKIKEEVEEIAKLESAQTAVTAKPDDEGAEETSADDEQGAPKPIEKDESPNIIGTPNNVEMSL